ncbi:PREDICTED: uncharacterized protein LOC106810727 [Priapulus caudatus]|uniref:Uncharacterized protein LOC106810727 n=1 Tax=Priapulus caudatus TaxID=37621 RepID=A0ABM1EBT0_PRICU|nr:PREDICTED: uncharacterized protein LOC106810727 [Priapulus caudatus]XP_014669652.1 PREDICTED: uncharacterized protein LOC106810727 [Priapulus caudatus]
MMAACHVFIVFVMMSSATVQPRPSASGSAGTPQGQSTQAEAEHIRNNATWRMVGDTLTSATDNGTISISLSVAETETSDDDVAAATSRPAPAIAQTQKSATSAAAPPSVDDSDNDDETVGRDLNESRRHVATLRPDPGREQADEPEASASQNNYRHTNEDKDAEEEEAEKEREGEEEEKGKEEEGEGEKQQLQLEADDRLRAVAASAQKSEVVYVNDSIEFIIRVNKTGMYVYELEKRPGEDDDDDGGAHAQTLDLHEASLVIVEEIPADWNESEHPLPPDTRFQHSPLEVVDSLAQRVGEGFELPPAKQPIIYEDAYDATVALRENGDVVKDPNASVDDKGLIMTVGKMELLNIVVPVAVGLTTALFLVMLLWAIRHFNSQSKVPERRESIVEEGGEVEQNSGDTSVLLLGEPGESTEDEC